MAYDRSKKYPDTADGARQYLKDESSFDPKLIDSADIIKDTLYDGVWCLIGIADAIDGPDLVVYLAGYEGHEGIRAENDFEECGYLPATVPMKDR